MLWTFACIGFGAALLALSYRRLLALREAARSVAPQLARGPARGELSVAERRAHMAELNEATIDLRAQLAEPSRLAKGCARAALSMGAFAALVQAARALGQGTEQAWVGPLTSFSGGCVAALGCNIIGRKAESEARRLREDWNALIRRSSQDVASEGQGGPRVPSWTVR